MGQWSAGTAFKNLFATCKIQIQKCLIGHIETPLVVNVLDMSSGQQKSSIFFGLAILRDIFSLLGCESYVSTIS